MYWSLCVCVVLHSCVIAITFFLPTLFTQASRQAALSGGDSARWRHGAMELASDVPAVSSACHSDPRRSCLFQPKNGSLALVWVVSRLVFLA